MGHPGARVIYCLPVNEKRVIALEDGSGSLSSRRLLRECILPFLGNPVLDRLEDSARISVGKEELAFTTDAFVVSPLFFPGGDIGKLAVCGTVNDLAVMGARPLFLSSSFILEEGLERSVLEKVVRSMGFWARIAGAAIVAGDTKVVGRGNADGIYISTSGVGRIILKPPPSVDRIRPGDCVILSGTAGDHGMAILAAREKLDISSQLKSDCAPVNGLLVRMVKTRVGIKFMRDPTRGGLAAVLNEIAEDREWGIDIVEGSVPVHSRVRAAADILGLDPLVLASEGRMVAVAANADSRRLVSAMRSHPSGRKAAVIGRIVRDHPGLVSLKTRSGGERILDWPRGGDLPRIC
jgi:hydrogenase expression/formation protein HypE